VTRATMAQRKAGLVKRERGLEQVGVVSISRVGSI
jgi:hypothetical protein